MFSNEILDFRLDLIWKLCCPGQTEQKSHQLRLEFLGRYAKVHRTRVVQCYNVRGPDQVAKHLCEGLWSRMESRTIVHCVSATQEQE